MQRRSFIQSALSSAIPFIFPRWLRTKIAALLEDDLSPSELSTLHVLANVVLPSSLGHANTIAAADDFVKWFHDYKSGADMDHGYGFTILRVLPPNPAAHYGAQLQKLGSTASAKGATFAKLSPAAQRELVEAALIDAKVERIPPRPEGLHVAADLMSHFFHSAAGQDFLYAAAIQTDDCRGLPDSPQRPASLKSSPKASR